MWKPVSMLVGVSRPRSVVGLQRHMDRCIGSFRTPFLAIYLLRMRRKRPLYYFRFKILPRRWVSRVRFFKTWCFGNWAKLFSYCWSILYCACAETATYVLSIETLMPDLSSPCSISYMVIFWQLHDVWAFFAQSFTQTAIFLLRFKFLTLNLKLLWSHSNSTTKFSGTCRKFMRVWSERRVSWCKIVKFWGLDESWYLLSWPPKGT